MRQGSTWFLRAVVFLIGAGVLAAMVRFPQTEGRAANLDLVSIYADPLIIYGYLASIPFFFGLYQAFKLLGYVDRDEVFSPQAVHAVRNIKYCALAMPLLIAGGEAFIVLVANGEDAAGPVALGIMTSFVSIVIAVVAGLLERLLESRADMRSSVA
ncbi:MAG: DUF2975 domain-containing protein [Dehalococcoidia bacterium]|nr:DUF2975 domain-containing protein [Dehalococcoidia bacterium]